MRWTSAGSTARGLAGAGVAALVAVVGRAVWALPERRPRFTAEELARSGVDNPVTGVLMSFRGYDTLLEMAVLLLAVLSARALSSRPPTLATPASPVLDGFVRVAAPGMVLVAGYLLWVGSHAPGGAFQAGAILGAAGVLMFLGGANPLPAPALGRFGAAPAALERLLLVLGLAAFLAVGIGGVASGGTLLAYPAETAKGWILAIEATCTLSIGAVLTALFVGGRVSRGSEP
jgi:multisubunit Na+/H+ antiporter MnhB subunit